MTTGALDDGADREGAVELDERGRVCPLPVIALAKAAAAAPAGTLLRLLADDPAAGYDVAAWCRMRGHELLAGSDGVFLVRLASGQNTGGSSSDSPSNAR